jgi:DNA-binding MarR family transcriptional regulator
VTNGTEHGTRPADGTHSADGRRPTEGADPDHGTRPAEDADPAPGTRPADGTHSADRTRSADGRSSADTAGHADISGGLAALDVIEHQTAVLVRNFELLHRRTTVHDDLDRSAYLLLRVLSEAGPLDINSLAGQLGLDPSTAGRQVSSLLQRGLAERAPAAADRRRSIITPTPAGLRRMEAVRLARAESLAALLGGWSTAELRSLGEAFTRYNTSVARHFLADETDETDEADEAATAGHAPRPAWHAGTATGQATPTPGRAGTAPGHAGQATPTAGGTAPASPTPVTP